MLEVSENARLTVADREFVDAFFMGFGDDAFESRVQVVNSAFEKESRKTRKFVDVVDERRVAINAKQIVKSQPQVFFNTYFQK